MVIGLITTAVGGAVAFLRHWHRRRTAIGQPVRATVEQVIRAPWGVAFPGDLPDPSEFEARYDVGEHDTYDWLRRVGGIDHGETTLRLLLVGNGTAPVLIRDIRVSSTRLEPYSETLVEYATAGALSSTILLFDLDVDDPDPWEGVRSEFEAPKKVDETPYFDRVSIELAPGEHHDLLVVGQANRFRVEWWLELHVLVDGKESVVRLDDNGTPFLTNGVARDRYTRILEWMWYQSPPHFGTPPDYGQE